MQKTFPNLRKVTAKVISLLTAVSVCEFGVIALASQCGIHWVNPARFLTRLVGEMRLVRKNSWFCAKRPLLRVPITLM